jgi:hypothetical protein
MQKAEAGVAQVEDESDVRQWEDLPGPALKVSHEAASAWPMQGLSSEGRGHQQHQGETERGRA